ncbi:hypothetical protein HPP92_001060 [Vanilla planifolia]|uniref:Uncharacterized protein n=1 Tax=Vanilla planifolia TaxID=51239 RepID=A0A835SBY5_VANPL|nr:hypothetical protein HPP92_001060 [Vanilla planifolia]
MEAVKMFGGNEAAAVRGDCATLMDGFEIGYSSGLPPKEMGSALPDYVPLSWSFPASETGVMMLQIRMTEECTVAHPPAVWLLVEDYDSCWVWAPGLVSPDSCGQIIHLGMGPVVGPTRHCWFKAGACKPADVFGRLHQQTVIFGAVSILVLWGLRPMELMPETIGRISGSGFRTSKEMVQAHGYGNIRLNFSENSSSSGWFHNNGDIRRHSWVVSMTGSLGRRSMWSRRTLRWDVSNLYNGKRCSQSIVVLHKNGQENGQSAW